ncbi:MAG: hypothetical protein J1F67_08360 [Muribaculaceae bacterium]|nr:hypothetical protein [Muribaculaceae bacterium]
MSFNYKNIIFGTFGKALIISFLALTYVSCVDDKIEFNDPNDASSVEVDGDAIGFYIALDKSLQTRDVTYQYNNVESKDDWIDMQDKFRVFFFNEDGDFLFGANDRIVGSVENFSGSTAKDYWYVRIPMTMIVDRKNQVFDINKIKSYLKNHPFKIAVLANWPNADDKINPSDFDDSSENNFKENPSSTLKGEPLWGWENSILNSATTKDKIRNINDLHHIYEDTYYANNDKSDRPTRLATYGNFMANYTDNNGKKYYGMGQPTEWVQMRDIRQGWNPKGKLTGEMKSSPVKEHDFESKETANQWIRYYWNPDMTLNEEKQIYRHYQHLWYLWNFSAIARIGKSTEEGKPSDDDIKSIYAGNFGWNDGKNLNGGSTVNRWGLEWWERNGEEIYNNWMKGNESNLQLLRTRIGSANNSATLTYVPHSSIATKLVSTTIEGIERFGVLIPVLENQGNSEDNQAIVDRKDGSSKGYFTFLCRTSGTLRIKWGSSDGKQAKIVVQKGGTRDKEFTIAEGNKGKWFDINGTDNTSDSFRDISLGGDSEDMYIWSPTGNAIIYGIEYIRGKYLYDTDRIGVFPNDEQGIPMYGVQQFEPIPDWEYGTTYNLHANISLIRALAKVILYIPSFNNQRPKHVYMRCMNRTAHCEPMDVETNTSDLWDESDHNVLSKSANAANCEWFNIQKYGPGLVDYADKDEVKNTSQLDSYKKFLSWFYGSWKNTTWKFDGDKNPETGDWQRTNKENAGWDFKHVSTSDVLTVVEDRGSGSHSVNMKIGERADKYPHLFNPHINRSDFCSFIYVGKTSDGLNKYVLYLPDKYIDDPNYPGIFSCTPKVPHIEIRYDSNFKEEATSKDGTSTAATVYNHPEFNLDDNECRRIYFTNYGYSTGTSSNSGFFQTEANTAIRDISMQSFDEYERKSSNLAKHWPIMRNHIYEFYVSTSGPETPEISVMVTDWSHKKVVVDW